MLPCLPDKSAVNFWWEPPVAADRPALPGPGGAAAPGAARARRSSLPAPRATSLPAAVPARRRGARSLARSPLALPSSLPPSFCLLPLHGCLTEPLNSHRSPPPLARRARGDSAPAGALGRAGCRPPSNSPRHRFPALATHGRPPGASRPRDPLRQRRCGGARDPQSRRRSPAREATHLCAPPYPPASRTWARGRGPCVLLRRRRRGPSVPVRPSSAGRAAVRVSWRGCAGGCGAEQRPRARRQLRPPRSAPPPSWSPASRAAAVSPEPRAGRPRCPRHRSGGALG